MSIIGLVVAGALLGAAPAEFTLLHTNDWQSRLLGFGPNAEYSPDTVDDDPTRGGVARLATLIGKRRTKGKRRGPVLLLDGGDWTMGTLFQTISRETGAELQLMKRFGYDAVAIGNHDFDYGAEGLAAMIGSAKAAVGDLMPILSANMVLSSTDERDDGLEALLEDGTIQPYVVLKRAGVRFGVVGLMGNDAVEVCRGMGPVTFTEPVETIRRVVKRLRGEEKVDVVIVLSHSGVFRDAEGNWMGEEVELAKGVPGIDVIVGGHSHTVLRDPIRIGETTIVQAGSDVRYLGELRMKWDGEKATFGSYELHAIDDHIPGDPEVTFEVELLKQRITSDVLSRENYAFDQPMVEVSGSLSRRFDEYTLGNLVTDAIRRAADADVAFTGNGTIRDEIHYGGTGLQRVSDLFRVAPLGIGVHDDLPGYPLVKLWVTGRELKSIFEVLNLAYQMKGPSYYPRISGARFRYNELRVPFDRVMDIELGDLTHGYHSIPLTEEDPTLYSMAATSYVASFFGIISELSHGLLTVVPKDETGAPLLEMNHGILDGSPGISGIQEIKEWKALLDYMRTFPDSDGDGVPNLEVNPVTNEIRMRPVRSFSPMALSQNATYLMGTTIALCLFISLMLIWLTWMVIRRLSAY